MNNLQIIINIAGIIISALISFLIASFKIGEYKNKVTTCVNDITELQKEMKEVRDKVVACETTLFKEPLLRRKSPVDLSERGEKVLVDSKGKDFVDGNYLELKKNVEEKNPQTSYDIQEFSRLVIEELKNDERVNAIKDYLFKEGMELSDIVNVLGIYLRNRILQERKIELKDIDKHTTGAEGKIPETQ